MKGTLFQSGNPVYNAIFNNVDKVKKSDKVFLNGVTVGTVTEIRFVDINRPDEVRLSFSADRGLKIPKDSKLEIISTSLMGNMGCNLILGKSREIIKPGEAIAGQPESGLLSKLSDKIAPLAESSNALLRNANTLFDRSQKENIYITINELNHTLANANAMLANMNQMVTKNQKPLNQTFVNFEKISSTLATQSDEINMTIHNIRQITDRTNQAELGSMIKNLDRSVSELNGILSEINHGNGTLSKLMKDPILYNNLNTTVSNANELLLDFKSNPKRYVGFSIFGGKR